MTNMLGFVGDDKVLWICRGLETPCERDPKEGKCENCIEGKPEETVEELIARVKRGDA